MCALTSSGCLDDAEPLEAVAKPCARPHGKRKICSKIHLFLRQNTSILAAKLKNSVESTDYYQRNSEETAEVPRMGTNSSAFADARVYSFIYLVIYRVGFYGGACCTSVSDWGPHP